LDNVSLLLDVFDILKVGKFKKPYVVGFDVSILTQQPSSSSATKANPFPIYLDIGFINGKNAAIISGIEIIPLTQFHTSVSASINNITNNNNMWEI
jgi:hypothetical protein